MISGMRLTFLEPLSCFIFIPFLSLPDNPDEMNKFELTSAYRPTGDQPEAIAQLTEGVLQGVPAQTLLGVTGSGKTFTIANVIANINNFNVIYLLTNGRPASPDLVTSGGSATTTDLLITWLFNITTGATSNYKLAAVIAIMIFVVVAVLSLIVYNVIPSTRNEEDYS